MYFFEIKRIETVVRICIGMQQRNRMGRQLHLVFYQLHHGRILSPHDQTAGVGQVIHFQHGVGKLCFRLAGGRQGSGCAKGGGDRIRILIQLCLADPELFSDFDGRQFSSFDQFINSRLFYFQIIGHFLSRVHFFHEKPSFDLYFLVFSVTRKKTTVKFLFRHRTLTKIIKID